MGFSLRPIADQMYPNMDVRHEVRGKLRVRMEDPRVDEVLYTRMSQI